MRKENWSSKMVYLDPELDKLLEQEARATQGTKEDLLHKHVKAGMALWKKSPGDLAREKLPGGALVLRTPRLDPELDDRLRVEGFDARRPKNDVLRIYLRLGMQASAFTQSRLCAQELEKTEHPLISQEARRL